MGQVILSHLSRAPVLEVERLLLERAHAAERRPDLQRNKSNQKRANERRKVRKPLQQRYHPHIHTVRESQELPAHFSGPCSLSLNVA